MSFYRVTTLKSDEPFYFRFSGKVYEVDDHTGTLKDDTGEVARLSYLQGSPFAYSVVPETDKVVSDGGPSSYYDFPQGMLTLNDLLEFKGDQCWKGDSFHLANIVKATWRWGTKQGTTKPYDARKIIYSGARLLMKYAGVKEVRKTLQQMLDDDQFKERE